MTILVRQSAPGVWESWSPYWQEWEEMAWMDGKSFAQVAKSLNTLYLSVDGIGVDVEEYK